MNILLFSFCCLFVAAIFWCLAKYVKENHTERFQQKIKNQVILILCKKTSSITMIASIVYFGMWLVLKIFSYKVSYSNLTVFFAELKRWYSNISTISNIISWCLIVLSAGVLIVVVNNILVKRYSKRYKILYDELLGLHRKNELPFLEPDDKLIAIEKKKNDMARFLSDFYTYGNEGLEDIYNKSKKRLDDIRAEYKAWDIERRIDLTLWPLLKNEKSIILILNEGVFSSLKKIATVTGKLALIGLLFSLINVNLPNAVNEVSDNLASVKAIRQHEDAIRELRRKLADVTANDWPAYFNPEDEVILNKYFKSNFA
jgi:hypothetical protein